VSRTGLPGLLQDDEPLDALDLLPVGNADDAGLQDVGVPVENILHLGGVDVHPRRLDHPLLAELEVEEAVGMKPATQTHLPMTLTSIIGDLSAKSVAILSGWLDAIRLTTDLNYLEITKPLRR